MPAAAAPELAPPSPAPEQAAPAADPGAAVAAPVAAEAEAAPRPDRTRWLVAAAALLVAGIAGVGFWLFTLLGSSTSTFDTGNEPALRAARAAVPPLLGYDYRRLDADLKAATAVLGDVDKDCAHRGNPSDKAFDSKALCFRTVYTKTYDRLVKDFALQYKVVASASVSAAGVEHTDGDRATVLLFVNTESTRGSGTPMITQSRVEMLMHRSHGRWLVANIAAL